jgi:peptidoglycan/LPS O-acetylase OafA/YrhL
MLAMLVMLQHFAADLAPMPLALAMAPFAAGSMAVRVFFALSGFVITEAVDCVYRDRPGAFLANRLLRIGPHFVLALALSMLAHEFFRLAGGEHLWRSQPDFPPDAFAINNVLLNFLGAAHQWLGRYSGNWDIWSGRCVAPWLTDRHRLPARAA